MTSSPIRPSASLSLAPWLPLLEQFEEAWRREPPDLTAFLRSALPAGEEQEREVFRCLLEELVKIDLECRWRRRGQSLRHSGSPPDSPPSEELTRRPLLEEYCRRYPQLGPVEHLPCGLIVEEYRARQRWGDHPSATEYVVRFPHQAAELPDILARVNREVSEEGVVWRPSSRPQSTVDTVPPRAEGTLRQQEASHLPAIPGYDVLGELGRGGMGVVYKARHQKLNRIVALKMVLHADQADEEGLLRFLREAEAVAQLQHPNVVQLFDVGQHSGLPFFTLELVPGGSLADKLREQPLPPTEVTRLLKQVAQGVQHANERGIVHRDLKPANVLLAEDGTPKVTDFGLARRVETGSGLTATGAVMGTPSYMAPEQARGRAKEVGPAADVYALGAILYECLTGRPPFLAATVMETLLQVIHEGVVPVRALQPGCPRDLETVCLKCLETEPGRRYGSAAEVAEELGRVERGEPVRAVAVGRLGRLWRWSRRNPTVAGLLALAIVLLVTGTTVSAVFGFREAEQARLARGKAEEAERLAGERGIALKQVEAEKTKVQEQLAKAQFVAYAFRLREAAGKLQAGRLPEAEASLQACEPTLRGWEHTFLFGQTQRQCWSAGKHGRRVGSVAFSPDGQSVVSGGEDQMTRIWDTASGEERLAVKDRFNWVFAVAYSPDGKRIATGSRFVTVWDAATGRELLVFKHHNSTVSAVCFSPDGNWVGSGDNTNAVKIWGVTNGEQRLSLEDHAGTITALAFSLDGARVASGSRDKTIKVWDLRTGKVITSLKGHTGTVNGVTFSQDGRRVISASRDNTLRVWNCATGELIITYAGWDGNGAFGPYGMGGNVTFSADGTRFAIGTDAGKVLVGETATGKMLFSLRGHGIQSAVVAMNADGSRVVSGGWDNSVRMWDVTSGREVVSTPWHLTNIKEQYSGTVFGVAFSPDGNRVASASADRTVKVCDAATGQEIVAFKGHTDGLSGVAFSPDGKQVASGGADKVLKLWDPVTGNEILSLRGHQQEISAVAFSPDGKSILSVAGNYYKPNQPGEIKLWDASTGLPLRSNYGHADVILHAAFSPDGTRFATSSRDKTVRIWNTTSGEELACLKGHQDWVSWVAFSPNGERLASASRDKTAKVWDAQTGEELFKLTGHTVWVNSVAFTPDGTRLATGSDEGTVRLWDTKTGQEALTIPGASGAIFFSPNGTRLACAAGPRVKVWTIRRGQGAGSDK